ncbi:hypothetical protein CANCADRAFT_147910 [Tortispora caseinolytica NRRL Y-17796]|uniref:Chromatin modification-related protein n=1 Tax=Tortispora caseinolytica NRRL Y-17796 TaxID=767744 RepID=A0A1E4TEK0_9ASCO|nr:hypothetical protein CANCADRAFT_147910 [Tortispora caseinolytica NRRL Y-17796]
MPEAHSAAVQSAEESPVRTPNGLYTGVSEFADVLEAVPAETVPHISLLREIEAKSLHLYESVNEAIKRADWRNGNRIGPKEFSELQTLIGELIPTLEEKIHVADAAYTNMQKVEQRLNSVFKAAELEVPEVIRYGDLNHPAIVQEKPDAVAKSAQSGRSEARREALAARRAAAGQTNDGNDTSRGNTPVSTTNSRSRSANANESSGAAAKRRRAGGTAGTAIPGSNSGAASGAGDSWAQQPLPNGRAASGNAPSEPHGSADKRPANGGGTRPAAGQQAPDNWNRNGYKGGRNSNGGIRAPAVNEPVYCYCQQVSYGEMVGCDGAECEREWFHLPCVGLSAPPKGQWFCDECSAKLKGRKVR